MNDPTQPVGAALGAGLGALFISELGFPPGLLAVSFAASTVGLLLTKPRADAHWYDRWLDLAVFMSAIFCGAWLGTSLGPWVGAKVPDIAHPTKLVTIVIGIFFHPAIRLIAGRLLPALSDKIATRKPDTPGASQ